MNANRRNIPRTPSPPPPARRRILLVDDHPLMREGIAQWIQRAPELEVCGEAGSVAEGLALVNKTKPDLVLTDLTLETRGGLELIKDLQVARPNLPILVISMHDEMIFAERVLRAGARGYIMKEAGGEKLIEAVRWVLGGQVYVSPKMSAMIMDGFGRRKSGNTNSPLGKLSDREFDVFQLIGQGRSTRQIAARLNLSPKTVDVHRSHIKEKLKISNMAELISHAVRWMTTKVDP